MFQDVSELSVQVRPKAGLICFSSSSIACYQPCFPWKCLSFCLKERYTSSEWAWLFMSFIRGCLFIVLKEVSHFGIYVWEFAVAFLWLFGPKPSLNVLPKLLIFQVIYLRGMFCSKIWSSFKGRIHEGQWLNVWDQFIAWFIP